MRVRVCDREIVCVCVCVCEREREKKRETDRERERVCVKDWGKLAPPLILV